MVVIKKILRRIKVDNKKPTNHEFFRIQSINKGTTEQEKNWINM